MSLQANFPILSEKEFSDVLLSNREYCRSLLEIEDNKKIKELEEHKEKSKVALLKIVNKNKKLEKKLEEEMKKFEEERLKSEEEMKKFEEERKKFQNRITNAERGVPAVYQGMTHEEQIEYIVKGVAENEYDVINNGTTKKMDLRLRRKDGKFDLIGIECKNKINVSSKDIEKFQRDKSINNFYRNIFICINGIKGFLEGENQIKMKDNELYIVSNDPLFIAGVMNSYLKSLNSPDAKEIDTKIFDRCLNIYNSWEVSKKALLNTDKAILLGLELHPDFTEKLLNGHVYLSTKSQFKSGKTPY